MVATTIVATGVAEPHRFSVDEYHRMADAGILRERRGVELLRGEIIEMSPNNPPHAATVALLDDRCHLALTGRAVVRCQLPIALDDWSEPEPDIALLRWRDDFYSVRHPMPEDVLLLMEVADSSLAYDRDIKAVDYAGAGIPEYWLWDLVHRLLLVHRDPTPNGYRQLLVLRGDDEVSPLAFPDLLLTPNGILPATPV